MKATPCCSPGLPKPGPATAEAPAQVLEHSTAGLHDVEQRSIPGGRFVMGDTHGDGYPADGERPAHPIDVDTFEIDATTVTNQGFERFVDSTGYRTEAEVFGFSAVFHGVVAAHERDVMGSPPGLPWWLGVRGASWRHPEGLCSDISDRGDHPVVHVSWNDARAYCDWAGRRLPSEVEWEYASRGGLTERRYPWGDDLRAPDGSWRLNIWQGCFPAENTGEDGWLTTAPVRSFEPNGFGLWQTVGNVWEWCADVFVADAYAQGHRRPHQESAPSGAPRTIRGGSYLCHDSYCNRYRNAARSANTPDSSSGNTGFRTVAAPPGKSLAVDSRLVP